MSRNMHRGRAPKSMGRTALRVLKMLRGFYPVMLPAVACCILIQCVVQAMPNVFMERALTVVGQTWESGDWAAAQPQIFANAAILAALYFASLICNALWQQCMAIITQGSLKKFRCLMFDHMQDLPIRYFDTHQHGDVMSYYTNDIDAMRQMIAQSLPQLFLTMLMLCSVGCIMLWYSLPLTLVVVGGAAIMALLGKTLASRSAKNFLRTQRAVAAVEGLVEEVMNGEKVVKVFSHERQIERAFDELNDEYQDAACTANSYANTLMPILMNAGNLLYVIVAMAIGVFLVLGIPNPAISGLPLTIAVGVPFLNMTKQFANQIGQISNQVNSVVMGLAGAERIFELLDEEPEQDEGYVELVACTIDQDGTVRECQRRDGHWAGQWAWKHPHQADGTVTYTPLAGDVRLFGVDFAYEPGHTVLHDVSLYAKPGQKVAFVGATGAGKTTITNLLNRFYDIEDGKIRYDGININKIKKPDLRRSLGVVLQDVNLFTGTGMDNIRYGRLDATDEEGVAAARLAGADDFVRRLPDGYETMLTDNGANLSQGQRQLLSIARAAV
ncbi:ABC transporter ATP-binding protein, partial [Thermophilibacter provencensis]|uniref:ABC transporter ATP-binding protein n=1 Tax=Thermophilibacter provencensis TaxID=1852386 RepID=UPI003AA804E1